MARSEAERLAARRASREKWRTKYPELDHESKLRWDRLNVDRRHLKQRYGITPEQKVQIFESQGSCCAVCKSSEPRGGKWATDHCHVRGKVRGVICNSCNTGLGLFADNPDFLREAAEYLVAHSQN